MASQNIAGMGVLASFGYRPPLAPILRATGVATMVAAPFGGHAVNLASISGALAANPDAHPDPSGGGSRRRPRAPCSSASGCARGSRPRWWRRAPSVLVDAVAGLALLGALAGALVAALADPGRRDAAIVTLVVSASGITAAGISASFWGLVAGLAFLGLGRVRG